MRPKLLPTLLGLVALGVSGLACGEDPGDLELNGEIAKLERDTNVLREVVAEAQAGTLIRPGNVLVGIHENAVLALVAAVLPVETTIPGKTPARIRIERVAVQFDGGLGTISVSGRAWLEHWPTVVAEVHLSGGFAEARVDPEQGVLTAIVALDTLEAKPADGGVLGLLLRGRLLRTLNARGRQAIAQRLPPIRIPLKLDQTINIPDLDQHPRSRRRAAPDPGRERADPGVLRAVRRDGSPPLGRARAEAGRVETKWSCAMRRWLLVAGIALLAAAFGLEVYLRVVEARRDRELREKRDRLESEKKLLQQQFGEAISGKVVPPAEVTDEVEGVVAVPNALVKDVLTRTFTDVINGLSLRVRGVEFHLQKDLRARLLVPKVTLGDFQLEILLEDVRGKIASGEPRVVMGHGSIAIDAPLKIVSGEGRVRLRFHWWGRPMTKVMCRNTEEVLSSEGSLVPTQLDIHGSASVGVKDAQFVVDPAIPAHKFRLLIVPSDDAWEQLRKIISARRGTCRAALKKVRVEERLRKLLAKGFPITVHAERLKTFRLPVELTQQVTTRDGKELSFSASASVLEIGDAYVWLGSELDVSRPSAAR